MRTAYRHIGLWHLPTGTVSTNRGHLEVKVTSYVRCGPPLRRWIWLRAHTNESMGNYIDSRPNWPDLEDSDGAQARAPTQKEPPADARGAVTTFSTKDFKGAPSARQADRPRPCP
jgi:hypothetical protein